MIKCQCFSFFSPPFWIASKKKNGRSCCANTMHGDTINEPNTFEQELTHLLIPVCWLLFIRSCHLFEAAAQRGGPGREASLGRLPLPPALKLCANLASPFSRWRHVGKRSRLCRGRRESLCVAVSVKQHIFSDLCVLIGCTCVNTFFSLQRFVFVSKLIIAGAAAGNLHHWQKKLRTRTKCVYFCFAAAALHGSRGLLRPYKRHKHTYASQVIKHRKQRRKSQENVLLFFISSHSKTAIGYSSLTFSCWLISESSFSSFQVWSSGVLISVWARINFDFDNSLTTYILHLMPSYTEHRAPFQINRRSN